MLKVLVELEKWCLEIFVSVVEVGVEEVEGEEVKDEREELKGGRVGGGRQLGRSDGEMKGKRKGRLSA